MRKRFPEIEKEQINASLPSDLVAHIRLRADHRGWSLSRTFTEALSKGLGIDPAQYGIEADQKQTA